MLCFLCHFAWSGNWWRRGYRQGMLGGMAKERPGTVGCCAPTAAFPAWRNLEGLWEVQTANGTAAAEEAVEALWFCFLGSQDCMWILFLRSFGLVTWRDYRGSVAVPAFLHKVLLAQLWCLQPWHRPGCLPNNGVLKIASDQYVLVLALNRASGSLGRKHEAKCYPRWCFCTRERWSWMPAMGGGVACHIEKQFS